MKRANVSGHFADLKGACEFSAAGSGSTTKAAVSRAFGELLKHPKLRRKRLHTFKLYVSVVDAAPQKTIIEGLAGSSSEESHDKHL